jgi:hypothetical protein
MRRALTALALVAALPAAAQLTPPPPPPRPGLSVPPPPPPAPETQAAPQGEPQPTPTPAGTADATPKAAEAAAGAKGDDLPLLGLMLDAGFPDGLAASLLVRPIWFLRLQAGGTYNFLGPGVRTGAALVPFHFPIVPTLSAEYGHAFDADAGALASKFGNLGVAEKILLKRVGYDYLSLQLGIETGSQSRFAWYFRAGIGWVWTHVRGLAAAAQAQNPGSTFEAADPRIRVAVPTVTTGFFLYLY